MGRFATGSVMTKIIHFLLSTDRPQNAKTIGTEINYTSIKANLDYLIFLNVIQKVHDSKRGSLYQINPEWLKL